MEEANNIVSPEKVMNNLDQSGNYFIDVFISLELISRFHEKIDGFHKQLLAKEYDALSKSIQAIKLELSKMENLQTKEGYLPICDVSVCISVT